MVRVELVGKQTIIDRLQHQLDRAKGNPEQIDGLMLELKKAEAKMKRLKENRKLHKSAKESLLKQIDEYRKDNEALV